MDINEEEIKTVLNIIETQINQLKQSDTSVHPYDIAMDLLKLRDLSNDAYEKIIKKIPQNLFAES